MVDAAMRGGLQAKEASALLKANVVDSLSRSISKYEITKRLSLEDVTVFSKIVAVRDLIEEWCQPLVLAKTSTVGGVADLRTVMPDCNTTNALMIPRQKSFNEKDMEQVMSKRRIL